MKIRQAAIDDLAAVMDIAVTTINETYPYYYPAGVIDSYLEYHTEDAIKADINDEKVYIIEDDNKTVGTVTIKDSTLVRLFVKPQYQGEGYGKALMDFSEELIFESFDKVIVESSLPAKILYKKRGYAEISSHRMTTRSGDYLCYDTMEKRKGENICYETIVRQVGECVFYETTEQVKTE